MSGQGLIELLTCSCMAAWFVFCIKKCLWWKIRKAVESWDALRHALKSGHLPLTSQGDAACENANVASDIFRNFAWQLPSKLSGNCLSQSMWEYRKKISCCVLHTTTSDIFLQFMSEYSFRQIFFLHHNNNNIHDKYTRSKVNFLSYVFSWQEGSMSCVFANGCHMRSLNGNFYLYLFI